MADPQDALVWRKIASEPGPNIRIMRARYDTFEHPVSRKPLRATVLEARSWCLIVPFTDDGRLVMVRQFRFGVAEVTLEIPAGLIDRGEEHADTARRELREETGYEGENACIIGSLLANPAIMNNQVHTVLVENCIDKHELKWDEGEDILTRLVPIADIPGLIGAGKIRHSIIVAALQLFALERGG